MSTTNQTESRWSKEDWKNAAERVFKRIGPALTEFANQPLPPVEAVMERAQMAAEKFYIGEPVSCNGEDWIVANNTRTMTEYGIEAPYTLVKEGRRLYAVEREITSREGNSNANH